MATQIPDGTQVPDGTAAGSRALIRPHAVVALTAGMVTGAFAAWSYYDDRFHPMAHSFGLWIGLLALLSARQTPRRAIVHACLTLAAAVVTFYAGKKVMYGIDYPGMPYSISLSVLTEWLVLAVIAGVILGWAFSWAGRPTRAGALGTAAVIGLLLADAYRRSSTYPGEATVVVAFATLTVVAVLVVTVRSWRQLALVAAFTAPFVVVGYVLVWVPDLLEQVLLTQGS